MDTHFKDMISMDGASGVVNKEFPDMFPKMNKRKLTYLRVHGLLKRPIKFGRYSYYDKDYLLVAISCNELLKVRLRIYSQKRRTRILTHYRDREKELIQVITGILDKHKVIYDDTEFPEFGLNEN